MILLNSMRYKKILLLNLIPDTIGDNILLTPLPRIIKFNFPNSRVDLTISEGNKELFLHNPYIDNLIMFSELKDISKKKSKISKITKYFLMISHNISKLKKIKYDLGYILLPNFPLNVVLPKLAGIKQLIGFSYSGSILDFLLDKKITYRGIKETQDYERHFIESYFDLLRLTNLNWKKGDEVCELFLSLNELKEAENLLKNYKLEKQNYVCFQSGSKHNSWPVSRFRELAEKIIKKTKLKIVLHGSKGEYETNEKIAKISDRIINLSGLSLREKAANFHYAKFSVCNDSGLAHMSSAVGVKTIVLFGPHSPKHCSPKGKGKVYEIYKYHNKFPYVIRGSKEGIERINEISVNDVMKVINQLID
jgi:ADP-heptose:LPS heptosyltransferase